MPGAENIRSETHAPCPDVGALPNGFVSPLSHTGQTIGSSTQAPSLQ